jgi:MFS family permease
LTNTNWRWCFGINLPVGIIGVLTIFLIIRKDLLGPQPIPELDETTETRQKTKAVVRLKTIDVGGQVLFLFGFGLIILALTWGGASYSWRSAAVLVPLVVGGLLALAFVLWEFLMSPGKTLARRWPVQRPMIPWHILADRNVGLLFYTAFTTGIAMYSVTDPRTHQSLVWRFCPEPTADHRLPRYSTSATCISPLSK